MSTTVPTGVNLTVLIGTLSRPPELRRLPSGDEVLALEVTVPRAGEPAESVPVAWHHPPVAAAAWPAGEAVVVAGRTRRRFFRAEGSTQSRTEVVATTVVPARRGVAVRRAIAPVQAELQAAVGT